MRTNALRWLSAAMLIIAVVVLIGWFQWTAHSVTPRTAFSQDANDGAPIVWPAEPQLVVQSGAGDAREIYRAALEMYNGNRSTYDRFARQGRPIDIQDIPAIDLMLRATHCSSAAFFRADPHLVVNLKNEKPELDGLRTLGDCMIRAALLQEKDRAADAMALYEATFALGTRLYEERLTYAELDAGLSLMAKGSTSISRLAETLGNASRAAAARQFDEARKKYVNERILPMMRILSSIDRPTLEEHFGDVLYFANYAKDPMWRIEAIFSLARYRFNAARIGDQNTAEQALKEIATNENDRVIRMAAEAGRDLTIEQYRMLK